MAARYELTRLETQFFEAAKAIDKLSHARKALAASHAEMGNKLVSVASTEAQPQLANALRKFGRAWHTVADSELAYVSSLLLDSIDTLIFIRVSSPSEKALSLAIRWAIKE